ncbi:hypothetical protein ACIP5N_27565 [Streptomyces sp. NPDC088768]|uniref:hypothetical protein n=1 Tax=Streptomyces sp. NPDC088768 TaxID=3365894 RepID=UPI003821D1C0
MIEPTQTSPSPTVSTDSEPRPVPGCYLCDNIAHERDRARANRDSDLVRYCNDRMRRHVTSQHPTR